MNEEEITQAIELPVSDEDDDEDEDDDNLENDVNVYIPMQTDVEDKEAQYVANLSPDLLSAFKIVCSLMNPSNKSVNITFMNPIEENGKNYRNYYQVIKKPMWLKKVYSNILSLEYETITEVVADLRVMLENCYRYYGQNHPYIKRGLKLETIIEQKLALLPSNLREQTTLEATSPRLAKMHEQLKGQGQQQGSSQPGLTGARAQSAIYQVVREEKAEKERERKRELMEMRKAEREAAHQETLRWEEALLAEHASDIRKMWELPQIGHFLYLAQRTLNLPEISQYEFERSIFMPSGSSLMATVMTSLLSSPHQRAKLDQWPAMLHKTWESRLKTRVQHWYKVYTNKDRNLLKVFELIGIEPEFFRIMGDSNPMETKTFSDLTLKQRIWILKSLCDYCLHNHKTVQDSILEVSYQDQREAFLGEDKEGNQYVHFPQFCGQTLRIYRTTKSMDILELDLKAPPPMQQNDQSNPGDDKQGTPDEGEENTPTTTNGNSKNSSRKKKKGRRRSARTKKVEEKPAKPQPPTFELVVESVEELRNLMDCFVEVEPKVTRRQSAKGKGSNSSGQPYCEKQLYRRLRNLLNELEPWEQKLEQAIIKSRLKLKKEWEDRRVKEVKQEEEVDNFWGMEIEEEVPQVNLESSSSSESDFEEDPNASEFRQTHRRTCTRRKRVWESESTSSGNESEPFKITVTSRGRICKMRNFNFVPVADKPALPMSSLAAGKKAVKTTTKPVTVTLNGMQPKQRDMLEAHRSQNSASDAQIQYQWETMRLQLLKENNADTASVKSEPEVPVRSAPKVTVLKEPKPISNSSLDTDAFLSAPSDFGSWKSSVPGSAFTEQTFTTLLNHSPCYKPSPPPVPKPPQVTRRLEFVRVSVPPRKSPVLKPEEQAQTYIVSNLEKPKSNIFRDKNASGNDGRFVKTTFTAPGILRTTISKRPSQVSPQKTVASGQSGVGRPSATVSASTSTVTTTTSGTVIPSLAKPGQKILVLPIKDASGNKILLQVVPKGGQPLKLSQVRGMTNVVTKKLGEVKAGFPNNNISAQLTIGQQAVKNISYSPNQHMSVKRKQQLVPNTDQMQANNTTQVLQAQNQQLMKNQNQPMMPIRTQQKLVSQQLLVNRGQQLATNQNKQLVTNQNQQLVNSQAQQMVINRDQQLVANQDQRVVTIQEQQMLTNKEEYLIDHNQHLITNQEQKLITNNNQQLLSNQQLLTNLNQQLVTHQNQQLLQHNELTNHNMDENVQFLSSPTHTATIHTDPLLHAVTTEILQSSVSQDMSENETLHNTMSHDLQTHQLLQASQELATNQMLHNSLPEELQVISRDVVTGQIIHTSDVATNHILRSPTHEHYSQNLSPTTNHLIASPTDHSQLIHTIQSANAAQLLASSLATQNQVIQASSNQILTSMSPVLANPDGTVTLLTQGAAGTMVLPVQTHIYAPQLYTSSEPKVIVCTNGQMLDGNLTSENLFVVTSNGQLVSMDNCAFQQTVLTEQMSPL